MRLTFVLFFIIQVCYGQYDHQPVFPNLEGAELQEALFNEFKPVTNLSLSQTRDTLYKNVFLHQDSVRCVYTTLAKYLDPQADPSSFLFEEGGSDDLNLEHIFPQGKGAGFGSAQVDMHHLAPTRVIVNSRRGNDPFVELDDNQVDVWYFKEEERTSRPNDNVVDEYSEDMNLGFEPKEDFKGNVARAYFYFYTMYRQQADAEDPAFFSSQVSTLCDWHELDPVDSLEWARTFKIAAHQDDKPNPFVLDCSLARLYCNAVSDGCRVVNVDDLIVNQSNLMLSPNPVEAGSELVLRHREDLGRAPLGQEMGQALIYDLQGRLVSEQHFDHDRLMKAPKERGHYKLVILVDGLIVYRNMVVVY